MSLYHYTNLKSLALILDSGKIRFTRLDSLDDLKEIEGLPEYLKSRFFVSCWTEDSDENISLWSLYTKMKGVRIEFPKKLYPEYTHKKGDYGHWFFGEDTICPLNIDEIRTDEYFISNPFWLEDGFYTKVIYDKNYKELKQSSISSTNDGIVINHIKNLLRYKNPIWQFQKESRFFIMAIPLPPLHLFNGNRLEQMKNINYNQINNDINYIDISLSPDVIDSIIVRTHPNCDKADILIIESLLQRFTQNGKLELSHLNDTYRTK
jgi:hypothetical protein